VGEDIVVNSATPTKMPTLCPLCRTPSESFGTFGTPARRNALCETCGSLERHRLTWLYVTNEMDLMGKGRVATVLHVPPDAPLQSVFRQLAGVRYVAADCRDDVKPGGNGFERFDEADASVDLICSIDALDRVDDEGLALAEALRVLVPGGALLLHLPARRAATIELEVEHSDPSHSYFRRPRQRAYGPDLVTRLNDAGFEAREARWHERIGEDLRERYGLTDDGALFVAVRPPSSARS
jgi:SAM-dependent methyltransferase